MSDPTPAPVIDDIEPDPSTAYGRLRTLWSATADPELVMTDSEVADVETVLNEHAAMAAELAEVRAWMADPFNQHRIAEAVKRAHRRCDESVEAANAEVEEYRAELKAANTELANLRAQVVESRARMRDKVSRLASSPFIYAQNNGTYATGYADGRRNAFNAAAAIIGEWHEAGAGDA